MLDPDVDTDRRGGPGRLPVGAIDTAGAVDTARASRAAAVASPTAAQRLAFGRLGSAATPAALVTTIQSKPARLSSLRLPSKGSASQTVAPSFTAFAEPDLLRPALSRRRPASSSLRTRFAA